MTLERYKARTGHYPARGLVDQSYRTCKNQEFCKQYGIRISGPQLGHPSKENKRRRERNTRIMSIESRLSASLG